MTSLMSLFLVIAITSSIVSAAPTFAEAVNDNVENFERGLTDTEQQGDVAEQEVQTAVQQGAVAKPRCITVCVGWGPFGACIRWGRRCYRGLNDDNAESANVQGSEVEQQEDIAAQEVQPLVQEGAVAGSRCFPWCKRYRPFGGCLVWGKRCSRGLNDVNAESANVQGSEVEQQQDVAEQEVEPAVQQGAVAKHGCITICVGWGPFGGCIRWGKRCYRDLNDGNAESANVQGSEVEQQEDIAAQEVQPLVQEGAVAGSRCFPWCKRYGRFGCIVWGRRCSRGLNDVNAESANVQGSEVQQQQDVAEQEVEPAVQQGAVAKHGCFTVCVGWSRNNICIRWGRRCSRGLNDGNAESANVQGSETEDKVDRSLNEEQQNVAEQEVLPEVQDAVVAPNRGCVKYCIGWTNRGKCYGWDWRC